MPPVIHAIATFFTAGLTAASGSFVFYNIAYVSLWTGLMAGLSKIFGPKLPSLKEGLRSVQTMKRSAVDYRKIVYGEACVSGPMFYNNVSGDNNEYLWYCIALADGPVEDITKIYIDSTGIPKGNIAWTPGASGADGTGTGNVSGAPWVGANSTNAVQIFYTLGHPDQVVISNLDSAFTEISTNHRLRGISCVVLKLLYNEDTEEVWRSGHPNNIKAVVKGRKIYDPRKDSTKIIDDTTSPVTYGIGAHRTTDSTTWEWSENPALCLADYLVNYMGVVVTAVNWVSIANAADDCDVLVITTPAASPENTSKRFTCNGAISLGSNHKDNLDKILSSFDGKLSYAGGEWKVRASVWEASSVSFDEDDLAGAIEVRGSAPKSERFNTVRGIIADPSRGYEPTEFPIITNSTYKTRDNDVVITRDLELSMTNDPTMAQRIGFRLLDQSDNQIICKIKTNARGAKASVGDVVSLTLSKMSWSSKTFRVIEWARNDDGTFDLTLREDSSDSYTDPVIGEYTSGNGAFITLPSEVVPPPVGLSASGVSYGIKLSWTNPASLEFDYIDIYASSTSAWSGAAKIGSVRTDTYTHNLGSGQTRYYWVRARRNSGDVSNRTPNSDTSAVVATSGSGTDSIALIGATLSDKLTPVSPATDAEVSYRLASTGEEQSYEGDGGAYTDISTWLLSGGSYDCRLTVNSGTVPACDRSPGIGVWLDMGTTTTWTLTDATAGGGVISNDCTIEIRDTAVSPITVLASANVTMVVENQAATLALTGGNITATNAGANAIIDLKIDSDGNIYKRENTGSWEQIAAGSNWIRPTTSAPDDYEVRYTTASGDTGSLTATAAEDTWFALQSTSPASDYTLTVTDTTAVSASKSVTLNVEIRKGGSGGYDASATYTLTADREDAV